MQSFYFLCQFLSTFDKLKVKKNQEWAISNVLNVVNYWRSGDLSHVNLIKDDYIRMNIFWCAIRDTDL